MDVAFSGQRESCDEECFVLFKKSSVLGMIVFGFGDDTYPSVNGDCSFNTNTKTYKRIV
ncbi:unnamed protein product [Acanthoscelides obtectus]|uniref:Uncharacterized protein n=1 Tax=Acanthoscelides obtectus TaxID=200917 RepID=A0A9P0JUJ2_ACAOB|nr:unnamed protein product [Acanthoscelides obtectus]CAK1625311.1 hypothetical protein AOBTE_LOCUS3100 [Acanthoscelides obtectus]